jgi:rhodanese-related sulfurtransferase
VKWDDAEVRADVREFVGHHLGDAEAVLVIDETGDLKKGRHTVGVQRQYSGTAGKIENCQVAVHLVYATDAGHAMLDTALYLPKSWCDDVERRAEAGVPEQVRFATKPQLASRMIAAAVTAGLPCRWVAGDEAYGNDPRLRVRHLRQREPQQGRGSRARPGRRRCPVGRRRHRRLGARRTSRYPRQPGLTRLCHRPTTTESASAVIHRGGQMKTSGILRKLFGAPYTSVGPQEATALLDSGGVLLDVREPAEWRAGHAPGARHIPLGQLPGRLSEVPPHRPVVTVCRSGARSRRAAALLAREGRQVHNLTGGMQAWIAAGLPLQAKGGRPGHLS